jgi:hypothetical protein
MGRDYIEELGLNGSITLTCILKGIEFENVYWIKLAQDWDQWRILVNKIMNFRVP